MVGPEVASALIAGGVGFFVLGFLFRDQVMLRVLVMGGSVCYILYYLLSGPAPLWDAMLGSALILAANAFGLVSLLLSRARFSVPADQRDLLDALRPLEPGLFRRLMRAGGLVVADAPLALTEEGRAPDALWFVPEGVVRIGKFGEWSEVQGPCFIGEIAWLQGVPATATVELPPGGVVVRWPREALARATRRSPRLATALEALIAQDMARKVAAGRPRVAPAAARGALGGETEE